MKRCKGFSHHCPKCGEPDTLLVELADVRKLRCSECEQEFTAPEVLELIRDLEHILDWLETAPEAGGFTSH